jgi:hypothetical protein
MDKNETLAIGNDCEAPFVAFGDDSQFGDSLTFAFAIVRREHLRRAQTRLSILREKYRIPPSVGIHCRVLFSRHERVRAGLSHLTETDARGIVGRVVSLFNRIPMILRFSITDLNEFRTFADKRGGVLTLNNIDETSTRKMPITVDPKGVIGQLAQACFAVSPDGRHGPPANQCEIFVAKDETKVKLFGEKKSKAHRTYSGFSDIGAQTGTVFSIEPTVAAPNECDMLEYADVAAYLTSHASSKATGHEFFREQLDRVRFWSRGTWAPNHPVESNA